ETDYQAIAGALSRVWKHAPAIDTLAENAGASDEVLDRYLGPMLSEPDPGGGFAFELLVTLLLRRVPDQRSLFRAMRRISGGGALRSKADAAARRVLEDIESETAKGGLRIFGRQSRASVGADIDRLADLLDALSEEWAVPERRARIDALRVNIGNL